MLGFLQDQSNKKASNKAVQAQIDAANKNRALFESIYNQSRADQAPYNAAGQEALNALRVRMGLAPMTGTSPATRPSPSGGQAAYGPTDAAMGSAAAKMAGQPQAAPAAAPAAAAASGGVNYQQLFQDRPDVLAEYQKVAAQADPNSPQFQALGLDRGQEGFADYWLQNKPAQDTYSAPMTPAAGAQPQAPADPNAPPAEYYQETYEQRPDALAVPEFQRGADVQFQDYGQGPQFSWDPSQIANDKGFQFETAEAAKGVNSNFAARGRLRSGGALKAMQDRLFGVAHTYGNDYFNRALQGYNANRSAFESNRGFGEDRNRYTQGRQDANFLDDRSYGTNLWSTLQNRNDSIFSEDRGFAANRNDQANSNLFALTGVGQNAAAGTASAGNVFANAAAGQNSNVADARSNAALWNAQNRQNLFGSAARVAGMFAGGGF